MTAGGARAQGATVEPTVQLELQGEWPPDLAENVERDLKASLSERGFILVDGSETDRAPSGTVTVREPRESTVEVVVRDHLSERSLTRPVDLSQEPLEVWSVLISASADELLRATSVEQLLSAPPTTRDEPNGTPFATVEGGFAAQAYSGGATLLGGDVSFGLRILEWLGLRLSFGGRGVLAESSPLGDISGFTLNAELTGRLRIFRPANWLELGIDVSVWGAYVHWTARPTPDATGEDGQTGGLGLRAGPFATAWVGSFFVTLRMTAGAPVVTPIAEDESGSVIAISGLELGGALTLGSRFGD
ncbi:MAG: hypothetical protein AAGF12_19975 [Myxococcota bacterium]